MAGPTDTTLIWALLSSRKLKPGEQKAFQHMYDDLREGKVVALSKKQRDWAMQRFNDLDLKAVNLPPQPQPKRSAQNSSGFEWEKNRPLKPPGR